MRLLFCFMVLVTAASAQAGTGPAWAWDTGRTPVNKQVQIESIGNRGRTHSMLINPLGANASGAVAKPTQSALTQPPTIIVQASSQQTYNYREDCYWLYMAPSGPWFIGAGKIGAGTSSGTFSFRGWVGRADGSDGVGGQAVLAMLLGAGDLSAAPVMCGQHDTNCVISSSLNAVVLDRNENQYSKAERCMPN